MPSLVGTRRQPIAIDFEISTIPLPASDKEAGTWGSAIITHPTLPLVIFSLPGAGAICPWVVVNVQTGEVARATRLRGDLRDALVTGDTALSLTTYALCNLRLLPRPEVVVCRRPAGVGKFMSGILDFGDEMIAVTGGKTVIAMRREDCSVVKKLRIVPPQASIRLDDSTVRLLSFHGEEATDYELPSLRRVARHSLPLGTAPVIADDEIYFLTGTRVAVDGVIPIEKMWDIIPKQIVAMDRADLTLKRCESLAYGARSVVGMSDGMLVVSTGTGLRLVRIRDLVTMETCEVTPGSWYCTFVPSARAVVGQTNGFAPTELTVVRWRPSASAHQPL